ncbi:MAG: glycosyltransferase [Bacteroidales bacterium]|jgi:glycosyltransferase involved in cell wall biosynthesis|nr:glycosyltransferase [Bacteroidales bacterium]
MNKKRIAFLLYVHNPDDERVWYQQAESLRETNNDVFLISSISEKSQFPNTICFNNRAKPAKKTIKKFIEILLRIEPDKIICDNPISIIAAKRYKKQISGKPIIIYDITEWYPSKKNLVNLSFFKKIFKFVILLFISYYAGFVSDKFIFGECYKAKPFKMLFPWKKYIFLSYYAYFKQIKSYPIRDISKQCELLYSGNLTKEKGFYYVLNVVKLLAENNPETDFILKIISKETFEDSEIKNYKNLTIKLLETLSFLNFCEEIGKSDICFDLRKIDFENTRCLPIKIFYYMAAGRPVIYSNLKAIRKSIPEINKFGLLVNPNESKTIQQQIERYLKDFSSYKQSCENARKLAETKYNWDNIKLRFVNFIEENGQ